MICCFFCFGSSPYILTNLLHSQPDKYNHKSPKTQKAPSREKITTCCCYNVFLYMWFLCAVRPDSPQDVKVHHVSDLNITLTWSPGFIGHSQLSSCTLQVEYTCYYTVFWHCCVSFSVNILMLVLLPYSLSRPQNENHLFTLLLFQTRMTFLLCNT